MFLIDLCWNIKVLLFYPIRFSSDGNEEKETRHEKMKKEYTRAMIGRTRAGMWSFREKQRLWSHLLIRSIDLSIERMCINSTTERISIVKPGRVSQTRE